jgi:hypothetical protein
MSFEIVLIILFLQLLAHHSDYLLQAYQHKWITYIDLSHRAKKWDFFDFIPHDMWHFVQSIRNMSISLAPLLCGIFSDTIPYAIVLHFLFYAIGRAIGFTFVYYCLNKRLLDVFYGFFSKIQGAIWKMKGCKNSNKS